MIHLPMEKMDHRSVLEYDVPVVCCNLIYRTGVLCNLIYRTGMLPVNKVTPRQP